MAKILVISGHPNYKASVANRAILDEFHRLVPSAEIVYLDALYPDFKIDVKREQDRAVKADIIVFEFPMWWFSTPSLLHRYVEDVYTYGFAYGSKGNALKGKNFALSFTTGAPESAYKPGGSEGVTMEELMAPLLAMVHFVGMNYLGRVVSYGVTELAMPKDEIVKRGSDHAKELAALVGK